MKFKFSNKVIFIISPDRWGIMRLSKHHYAVELARKGNQVFFIEPPSRTNKAILIKDCEDHPNIHIVSYKPVFKGKRFLPAFIYRLMLQRQIRLICRAVNAYPHVVWSFDPYRFENLAWFNAELSIFHAVDLFSYEYLPEEAFTADICFCFSQTLTDLVMKAGRPTYFINHGLNKYFSDQAEQMLEENREFAKREMSRIKVGYIGNLLIKGNDRVMMQKVVAGNPGMEFIFWGQYEKTNGNLGTFIDVEVDDFISFLIKSENVVLKGPVHPSQLFNEMLEADVFWLCLDTQKNITCTSGVNPHKILEYLSTGKPFISHYITDYENTNLFYMSLEKTNTNYLEFFTESIARIKKGEPADLFRKRLKFALDNTYGRQIDKIEYHVNQLPVMKNYPEKRVNELVH